MTVTSIERGEPFFVGEHLAMDFLNSIADGGTEWLSNGRDLVAWLQTAGAIDHATAARFSAENSKRLDAVAGRARALREWLRAFLRKHAKGVTKRALADLEPLNALLAEDDSFPRVGGAHGRLHYRREGRWSGPDQLLQPLAAAIATFLCDEDLGLVRHCEGHACTLMFLDRTKSHARRWCSMAVCGNRAKAAAHRAKARAAARKRA